MLNVYPVEAFTDNYIWAIHDDSTCVVVDPGQAQPVLEFLDNQNLTLTHILITHHHYDHTGGVIELKSKNPKVIVYGPDNPKIDGIDHTVKENDTIALFDETLLLKVLEVPGHTMDHIAFYDDNWLFCGDTLFSAGCGRMFEGTPDVFWESLCKLRALNGRLKVFCAHEYTLANLDFARYVDKGNVAIADTIDWARAKRKNNEPTLPSTLEKELQINPFLQCDRASFVDKVDTTVELDDKDEVAVFAGVRSAKDNFK